MRRYFVVPCSPAPLVRQAQAGPVGRGGCYHCVELGRQAPQQQHLHTAAWQACQGSRAGAEAEASCLACAWTCSIWCVSSGANSSRLYDIGTYVGSMYMYLQRRRLCPPVGRARPPPDHRYDHVWVGARRCWWPQQLFCHCMWAVAVGPGFPPFPRHVMLGSPDLALGLHKRAACMTGVGGAPTLLGRVLCCGGSCDCVVASGCAASLLLWTGWGGCERMDFNSRQGPGPGTAAGANATHLPL